MSKESLKEGKQPLECTTKELKYAMTPFGKSDYKAGLLNKETDELVNGRRICNICGRHYTVKNSGKHKRTQYHLVHERLNKKLRDLILL